MKDITQDPNFLLLPMMLIVREDMRNRKRQIEAFFEGNQTIGTNSEVECMFNGGTLTCDLLSPKCDSYIFFDSHTETENFDKYLITCFEPIALNIWELNDIRIEKVIELYDIYYKITKQ